MGTIRKGESESSDRPVIRMASPPPPDSGTYTMTLAFDVDLSEEHKSYLEWSKHQPPEDAKPFLDEISHIASEVVNSITTSGMLDSAGWGISLRRGRVIINDVRHVISTEELNSDDEPF
jgi:hypothetical protein